jgi:hypothetical protein
MIMVLILSNCKKRVWKAFLQVLKLAIIKRERDTLNLPEGARHIVRGPKTFQVSSTGNFCDQAVFIL